MVDPQASTLQQVVNEDFDVIPTHNWMSVDEVDLKEFWLWNSWYYDCPLEIGINSYIIHIVFVWKYNSNCHSKPPQKIILYLISWGNVSPSLYNSPHFLHTHIF